MSYFDILTTDAAELQTLQTAGKPTSFDQVKASFDQIERFNHQGPKLNAIINTAPRDVVPFTAKNLDDERSSGALHHTAPVKLRQPFFDTTRNPRLGPPQDLDSVMDVIIEAMPDDPQWDYRFPKRCEFSADHSKYTKMLLEYFLDPAFDDWVVTVVEDTQEPSAKDIVGASIRNACALAGYGAEKRTFHFDLDVTDYDDEDVDFCGGAANGVSAPNDEFECLKIHKVAAPRAFQWNLDPSWEPGETIQTDRAWVLRPPASVSREACAGYSKLNNSFSPCCFPGRPSSRSTAEYLASTGPEHDVTLWEKGHPGLSRPHASTPPWLALLSMWLLCFVATLRYLLHASPTRPKRHLPRTSHTLLAPLFLCLLAAPLPASAQRHIPPALLHIAAGTSFATSATIPPLRGNDVPAPWWIAMYGVWAVAFTGFLVAELLVRPTWAQRRLLAGLLLFSGLNLTGSLVQGGDSILDGMASWGPLAMTASLWLVPVLMEAWGVRRAGRRAEGAVQAVELVGIM